MTAMQPHTGVCSNCCATAEVPAGWSVCCWNPTGCACTAVAAQQIRDAQDQGERRAGGVA